MIGRGAARGSRAKKEAQQTGLRGGVLMLSRSVALPWLVSIPFRIGWGLGLAGGRSSCWPRRCRRDDGRGGGRKDGPEGDAGG